MFHACPDSSGVSAFIKVGGDALAYCSHWMRYFLYQCLSSSLADRWSPVNAWWQVADSSHASERSDLLCKAAIAKSNAAQKSAVACKTHFHQQDVFWPWGICSKSDSGRLQSHKELTRGDVGDSLYVRLSLGDGVHGEATGTTCACATSLTLMEGMQCHTQLFMLCAIGCGQTLKDSGSGVFTHGGEVPYVFGLWFHQSFLVKLAMSRRYMGRPPETSVLSKLSTTRCSRPKMVTLESVFFQVTSVLTPISVAAWAHAKTLPNVFERKRPTASDHAGTVVLSMLWVSLGHKVKASFTSSEAGIRPDVGLPLQRLGNFTAHSAPS